MTSMNQEPVSRDGVLTVAATVGPWRVAQWEAASLVRCDRLRTRVTSGRAR